MFGQNPIRSQEQDPTRLAFQEMFYTLQGEGPHAGRPALFIRLAGCNLACHFCDTEFESGIDDLRDVAVLAEEIRQRFTDQQREFVVLTGGEPMRQNFTGLLARLFADGTKLVQIETAGTLWVQGLERYIQHGLVELVCSPKTPRVNLNVAVYCKHWKYIVRAGEDSPADGLPKRGTQLANHEKAQVLYRPRVKDGMDETPWELDPKREEVTIWLSPCDEYDPAKNRANMLAARDLCLKWGYRLSLQMHKIVEVA